MGYPQFPNYPYQHPMADMRVPRLTKPLVQTLIAQHIGVYPEQLNFERIAEVPATWRHACRDLGVSQMVTGGFPYVTGEVISYGVCQKCGRVYYHFDS